MNFMRYSAISCVCVWLMSVSQLQAGLIFEFGQANYQAAPNSTVNVDVFFTATDADRAFLLSTSAGRLFAIGVQVNNNQVGTGARVVNASDITVNTATFDDTLALPIREVGANFARMAAFTDNPDGVALPDATPLRVLVGTFRYTLGSTAGVTTTLSFADFDGTTNIAASNGLGGTIALDSLVNFGNTATITAVPEPGTMALFALVGSLGLAKARMRSRRRCEMSSQA